YEVIALDFQVMSTSSFESEQSFVTDFSGELLEAVDDFPGEIEKQLQEFADGSAKVTTLNALFKVISKWCGMLERPPVLIIDEVDTATNNQVFIDFLAQLRAYYLKRPMSATFQSVILAGVYDVLCFCSVVFWSPYAARTAAPNVLPMTSPVMIPFEDFPADSNMTKSSVPIFS
ncbi:MAG: hypothetical protein LUG88_05295, partial [Clostridia bacterium]|nr:hypothetical protein [Clostridia bacterium]